MVVIRRPDLGKQTDVRITQSTKDNLSFSLSLFPTHTHTERETDRQTETDKHNATRSMNEIPTSDRIRLVPESTSSDRLSNPGALPRCVGTTEADGS